MRRSGFPYVSHVMWPIPATDLLVESPPLKDDDVFGATSRPGQITRDLAAIGRGEMYRFAHNDAPLVSM